MVGLGIGAPIVQVYHEKSFILPDVSRVLACLYEKDVKFETHTASYKSLLRLQAASHAPVPFYDGPTFLEESREICRYIAEKYEHQGYPFLLGKDALERASVEQWLHNEEHAFNPPSRALFCHLAFPLGEEDDGIDMHMRKVEEVLEVYDQRLSDSEFLAGNKFTLADLVHLPNSHYIKASDKFLYLYDSRKNVRRWWDAISDRDSWKKVLRYMKRVEEQNKQEELKKQQQQEEEEEDPRTSADSIRLYSRKIRRTKPRTILVPPTDTVSLSSIVPQTKKPLPSDTSPDELLISSSHSTPATDKTSAVQSKETTIFTSPQETPPTSVQSTPVTSKKHSIPVQSTKHATSPTPAKKPPITDAAKSSAEDAPILESSSSKDVSSDLDVFDHYPSHTDVDTPYIEPTTRKTSETLDAFPEPDQPTASDFYKSDSTGTSVDSRFKESVPYSGRTPPELEPTDTSASKLHTTDVHRRLQVEQWHSAKTGLNDLKHDDTDHLVSTQQGKPRKDVQQYPSQDSEQATSHSVPQEPMSRNVLSQLEDYASSDQRGALPPPSTQEHGVTPSRQAAVKDARRRISSQAAYPGGQDTSKQPRDHSSVPRQGEPQDAREIFDESQAPGSTISSERFSYTSQSSLPRQDLDGPRHATAPFEMRYPGAEDTSKQAKDKISTPWQMTDHTGDVKEETKVSESSSFQVQPSYFERADAPSRKQETIDDTFKERRYHSVAPPSQTRYQTPPSEARYPTAEDANKQPRGTAPTPKKTAAQYDNDTSEESKTADEVASTEQPLDAWRSPVSPRRQKVEDSSSSDTSFRKRYPYDEDIQVANTASVSWQIAPDGDKNIFEETKLPDSTPTSAKPVYTPQAPFPPPRQAEVKDAKDKGRQSRVTIPESQKMVSGNAQTTDGERKTGTPGEQSSDRPQAIPQSRLPAAKGLFTKEEITNEQTVVPPLLSNEPTSRVQPAYESLQEVASRGGLSTKPSTIEQWQRATVPLNDITSSSGDGEIGAETPGVQSASPSFPGASTAHHATSDDKFARQSIIDERVGEPTKMLPTQSSAPAHTKRETPGGHEIVDSELVSTPDGHISEAAKIRQDQATVHEDVHDANLSAHDVAKDTFKEAKVAESTPSSAKPMYSQQPAPTPRHAEVEDTWDKGMKGREAVPDRHQMLEKWAGTAGEQVSDRWKASAPSRQAAAEDVRGATGDTIQSPDVLDTSKKSRGAYEEAKGPGSVKEEKTSSIYQKKPLVAQDNQEQAQTIPAGEKADGYMRKHQQASDAPNTFVEKLNASEPARVKTHGDFSAEQLYRKDTTDDQKVAPPLSTRQLTSHVQPPSEPSYDAALHRDLSSKPSTIYQWQRSSAPLHDVTSSSGDDEVAKSTVDDKPTPVSQQKSDEQRVEPPVPIEAEISGVQHASPSFPGASAATGDKFAKHSIIDERVGEPTQTQTSSQDARPSSEPTKRGTPEGHEVGELVSTPGGQISEAKKAGDDPAIVQEDVYDVNLSTQDVSKDAFMETKVADSIPSSAQPMHIQQPALTPSRQRQTQVEEARDKSMQSRETISEQPKMVERKTGISGEHLSDRQKEIRPSRQTSAEDATIQSSDILDTPKKSRATFEESIGPGSTLPKAQVLDAQDSQLTKGESTVPTTDQRKDWKYAKDDESIMTEENSLSTKRLREMFQESASTAPKTQLTDSEGSNALEKTSSVYRKGPLAAQDIPEEAQVIPADEKVYGSTSEHHESFGDPYNDGEKLSVSASARADIHDDHSAEEQYKKYTADDQKVDPSLSSKEPASQVQPASAPLQRAVPDGDLPSKSFTIDQWQRTGAPLHGVITDSGDDGAAMSSNNDQKSRSMSQEATPSSQSVNQMGKQSGEQRVEPPVPIVAEASDVGRAASSLPEAARADVPTISDKFTEQSNIDERMGKPKQMQAPITAAHPASARTMRTPDSHEAGELFRTPEGQRLEAAKATRDPATIHEDVYDASLPTHDAAIDEKTTTDHASGDEVITGSLHDEQAPRPASIQAQPTVETPHHSDSFQYVHTGDSGKAELAKPTVTDQEATVPAAGPTSADPQPADIVPAGVAHSEQKSAPSDKGSARAAQHPSPVEPIKADSNVSAANYTNAPQMIFRQQARPPAPSTIAIRTPDTQGVIGKIQEITPDNRGTDDSGKPFVPNQEHISHASEAIPGQEEMTSPQGARVFPTLGTQLSSADVHEATPDDQQTVESITPLVSSGKQGSHVRSPFKPGEVGPAEKKFAPSDEESPHSSEELISGEPRKEQTVIPTAEQTTAQPTIIGRQDIPDRKQALTSKDTLNNTATQDDVHRTGTIEPARRPLSVEGEELTPATQAPLPTVARDSFHTELENVQSVKPSATPDARDITPSSAPDEAALAEQKSALSGQSSADPAQPAFSLGPMNEIRDSSPSAMLISSTDPSKGDPMVSVRDQAKDSQTTPSQQDILFTEHPSGKVQENIPDDNLRKAKLSRPSSAIQEGKPSKASASGIQLGSVPNELSIDEQKFVPPDASHALSRDQESSPDDGQIRNLGSPVIASQEDASRAGRASEGSTPKVHSAVVDEKRTLPSSQAQTSSTGPDSGQIGGDAHLSGAGMPATSSMEKQEAEPPAATQAPTPKGLQDTANIKSPRQTSTDQTVTPAMNSAAPSDAPEGIEPGPDSSRSVQTPFSTEPTKEDTIATAGDQAEDMQTVTQQQAITPAPDTAKPTFPGAQDASMKFQESIPDDGPVENYSPKPATQTQPPLATLDVSPDASSKAKSTGQGSKPPTRYQASSPETQLGSSQTQGEAAPAEQKFAATDEKSANASKSFASAEPREEDADAAIADQTSVPPTKVTRQVTSSTPDASDALSRDQESSPDDGQIRNLGSPVIASQEDASRAGRASEGSTPKVHSAVVDEKRTLPSSQAQTSSTGPDSGQIGGDAHLSGAGMPATSSMEKQEAEPPAATQAPTPKGLQDTANIKSPRQTSTDQTVTPAMNSAAPSDAPEGIEPGPDSSRSVQTPFSTEPTKEDTIATAGDQAEDMQTVTQQQAITPAPDTAKPTFPGAQDASMKFQESIPDDGPVENYSPKPATQTQPPLATLDVSPDASSKAKSTGQGSKPPTRYQASSPETQLGSSQTQGEAAPAEQKFAATDEKSANASKSFASAEPREEDADAAIADQTSVPPTKVTRQVTSSTPDASDALSRDQESSPDDGQIRNLGSPVIASQEDASRAGRASEGSTPKVHSAVVDEKRTLPSSQAQTSSTGPDSGQIGGDAHLSGAGMPATSSMEKQEAEPPAATQAPTPKGLQDTANIKSPRQTSTDQTVTPAMNSAAPSDAPEGIEPGPDSSRSVQTPFSTEPTKEDTIATAGDQAEDMQTVTQQQAITPAPDTAKPTFPGAQDASMKFQESIPDDGPVENYSPKPATQTQPPLATLDVSPDASSKAKSTGQGSKPPTRYQASSPETQLGSSQTQGEAAPAEQKFAATDEKSANASKSFASAEPREEDADAAIADQTSVPPTKVTRQVTSSTPDASDALSRDQESSPDDGQIRNLGSPVIASQEDASRAGRASEGSTPKVHSAVVDEKRTLPSSQAQTSSTGPDSGQIGGDAHLSGAGMPATSSMEKQEAEPPAATQAPTPKGLQDTANIKSPRQTSTDQTVTPAMNSAAPSDAPEGIEPGPDSSRSVQTPFSTEPTKEDTIATAGDQAEDMQTVTQQQAITPAPDTAKPTFPGAQDASMKFQESIPDDGPVENYSPKPATQTQPPLATLDVSPDASSKAKSTGQGSKPPTRYQASSPETQLGSSQTQGEAAPAEQKFAATDEKSANASKSFASAEPREEDADAAIADQTSVPPTKVTRQVTSSTPDASDALSRDQESSPDDGQIRNLGSPVIASQEDASRAGRASEGSTPKVHSAVVDEKRTLPSSQAQTSSTGPDSGQIGGDAHLSGAGMPATSSMEKQEAEPPAATQAPTPKGLQDTANIKSPRQTSTDQTVTPAMNSAAPSDAPEGIEPGPDSSRSVQTPFSTEPTKEDTIATAGDQAEDMQTVTQQQAITPAPDTAKPTFPGAQDASMKFQESIPDDGPVENYSPKPATQTQPPLATLDVSPDASSKAKSTGQGSKPPTRYQASSPETQLGSSQTQGEAAPAEQKFAATDEKSANASKSFASAEPREEDADAAIADQTSVPPTKVTRQVTSSTPDASDALSRDQESSPDDGQIRNLGSPVIASQEDASRAGRASEGSTPKVHSAVVDEKRTLPSSQAQTSSTGPDSGQIGGDAHLSGAGMPATSSMEKQEAEPPAATQAPTPKGLQDTANIKSPRQTSTDQTVTPAMNSAAPSDAPEGIEPGPDSSRSVQTPFSTEPTKEDTIATAGDQAEDMQTVTQQQAITPAPDTAKPTFPGAQDASMKFQESIPDDGPVENYSPKPATQTQPPLATLDVSPDASSKAKSTGQGSKPPTRYQASSPETQLGSSQTQGEAAPAEQKFAATDEKSANASKSFASAEPREEDADAAIADQTSVPPTKVTRQVTSSTPDASDALSRDQESSPDDGQIRNLGSPVIASQEDASRAGRASEGSTPKVHSAVVDEKRTLPSSQAQTSSTGPDSGQIGGDAHLSGAGMPATSSMEKQEAEPPAATQAPTPKGLQDTANIKSPRQTSTDQTVTPAMNSAAPSDAPEGIEPGPDSSRSVQTPFSTEPTKEDTIATAGDQAEDMQTVTQQQAITPAPDTAKPTFPGAQDASMKFQESIPDDGPVENYSPKPATQTQPPLATLDVSPDASSKAKSTGQGSKPPTRYQASSPETQFGSSQTQGEAAPAEQKFAATDEKSANASKSFASAEPREEDADAAIADQTSVPPTKVTRQVTSSTPDASDALSRDQESSPDDGQIRNLGSPVIASQEDASRAGRASEGSTPKVHSAVVDEKRTLPSSQAQTSSTGPDSGQIGGDAHLSGAGMPATSSMEKQEAEPPAATQAPTPKGLQDTANIKSPRQTSTDQTVTPAMNSAAPSEAPEGIEPGPDSSRSVQTPFSTEPTNEDTIGTAADQAEDMQTVTQQQAFTPDPDTTKPSFPGAQDASRKFLKSIPDDGPLENYSRKPATQTQPHEATLDVSPDASSKAKSTGQGSKPPTRYQASSPETQLGSSQTQGEAAPAEQKFAATDEKSVNPSKPFASAEPREGVEAAIADQMSVPPTNVTRQVTSSTPDASHALSSDQVSSPDDGQIRNLGSPLIAKDASRAGRASEGSTPEVHSAVVDKKMTLPSSQAQTSSTGPDSGQIGGDARLSGADMPATSSMEKQEVEPPATTQAPTSKGLQDTGNIESPRQTSTDQTVTPAMNSAAPSDAPEGTEPGPHSSRSVQTPFSTEPTKEDTIVTAADAPRSSEESKVQLQSEDSTQGRGTDAPSFETGHPRNGRLPANNYKNNSSQSQAEASNKSIEQSSPDIWNKDNDSSRVDDSTDPTKPET